MLKISHQSTREQDKRRKGEKTHKNKAKAMKMAIRTHSLMITLNAKGVNAPTKRRRRRLAEWTQKQDPRACCVCKRPASQLETHTGWK